MGTTWILHTETKGTGANMVPLDSVTSRAPVVVEAVKVPRRPRPRPVEEPRPKAARRFRVVDVMTRRTLAQDASVRETVEALKDARSVVDVTVYVWHEERDRWRMLTFSERQALWALASADPAVHEPADAGPAPVA